MPSWAELRQQEGTQEVLSIDTELPPQMEGGRVARRGTWCEQRAALKAERTIDWCGRMASCHGLGYIMHEI